MCQGNVSGMANACTPSPNLSTGCSQSLDAPQEQGAQRNTGKTRHRFQDGHLRNHSGKASIQGVGPRAPRNAQRGPRDAAQRPTALRPLTRSRCPQGPTCRREGDFKDSLLKEILPTAQTQTAPQDRTQRDPNSAQQASAVRDALLVLQWSSVSSLQAPEHVSPLRGLRPTQCATVPTVARWRGSTVDGSHLREQGPWRPS